MKVFLSLGKGTDRHIKQGKMEWEWEGDRVGEIGNAERKDTRGIETV